MNLYTNNLAIDRYIERLLGPEIARLLQDGKTQEISVNADGRIRIDNGSGDEFLVEGYLKRSDIEAAVRMIAAVNGIWLDADAPFLNTVLLCGARFSAALPHASQCSHQRGHTGLQRTHRGNRRRRRITDRRAPQLHSTTSQFQSRHETARVRDFTHAPRPHHRF
jgi:hypothetical protein